MKTGRMTILGLVGVCLILILANGFLYFTKDSTAPTINIPESEVTYRANTDMAPLLEGVTATDDVDGDVSASLRIREMLPSSDMTTAMVVYTAKDNRNNVATASREVKYSVSAQDESVSDEGQGEGENTAENLTGEEANNAKIKALSRYAPKIYLTDYEITIERGSSFNAMDYLKSIEDDSDTYDKLSRRVSVSGEVNTYVSGVYQVVYYVNDSAGNKSNEAVLQVTVQ